MRVRLEQIEGADLNVLDFDFDLTFMVFFVSADGQVYGRYGGRDSKDPDARMSLAGLNYAMKAALRTHNASENTVPDEPKPVTTIRQYDAAKDYRGCIHCHQAKEIMHAELKKQGKWNRSLIWRYPLPDNLGFVLDVDRGDMIDRVEPRSPAANLGLARGDIVRTIGDFTIHSFADAIHALDRAPAVGELPIVWTRDEHQMSGKMQLPPGWRKTDITWRRSVWRMIPYLPLHGTDLNASEKQALKLTEARLAFRQRDPAPIRILQIGIQPGDIILGVDQKHLEMNARSFRQYIRTNYLVGDKVTINLLRDGNPMNVPITLAE